MNELQFINGVRCYIDENGVAQLNLEDVVCGLGFTKTETKNDKEYTSIRWERVFTHLDSFGFDHKWAKDQYIPEPIFYLLSMKAENSTAQEFQNKIAYDVLPTIRKHGAYIKPGTLDKMISSPEFGIKLLTALKDEQDKNKALEIANSALTVDKQIMQPKADYFDELVDRNLLTNFRDTAKELGIKQKEFISFLLEKKYLYRDKKGNLVPYAQHMDAGLFEMKECFNNKTSWSGLQPLITPKGRETFRLLVLKAG